ncbi:hypothetical protein [Porphyromonas endodontalis]|jgi:hypothetical protein|uniref:hypothetical protein n=1 Tax=Porphyromonas endodontalis TaxID=28124 RepID=UPI003C7B8FEF
MQNINSDTKVINSIEKVRISGRKGREREPEIQKRISRKVLRLLPNILQKTAHETFYSYPKKKKAQGSKIRAFHT